MINLYPEIDQTYSGKSFEFNPVTSVHYICHNLDLHASMFLVNANLSLINIYKCRNIGKPNNLKVFGSNNPKGLNRIAKLGYGHLCLSEETLVLIIITLFRNCIIINLSN